IAVYRGDPITQSPTSRGDAGKQDAIENAAQEFKTDAWRLYAVQRRGGSSVFRPGSSSPSSGLKLKSRRPLGAACNGPPVLPGDVALGLFRFFARNGNAVLTPLLMRPLLGFHLLDVSRLASLLIVARAPQDLLLSDVSQQGVILRHEQI